MRYKVTLLNILLFFAVAASAQSLTGIWRGYFAQSTFGLYDDRYKFEVQIDQAINKALRGVTYSYKTTVFYGKASFQGIYTPKTNNVIFNELKLVELKIDGKSSPCLMTCYLEYSKMGTLETLTGTYTSRTLKNSGDCGEGKVYLERTTTTDFHKEDFIVKKEQDDLKKSMAKKPGAVKRTAPPVAKVTPKKPLTTPKTRLPATTPSTARVTPRKPGTNPVKPPVQKPGTNGALAAKPRLKPGAEDAVTRPSVTPPPVVYSPPAVQPDVPRINTDPVKPKLVIPKPEVLKRRTNELVKTIYTSAPEVKIELYDNGEIDGDTISVYHNNQLIISRKRLTDKPITYVLRTDNLSDNHEFVMVAENLGTIPPNTALMIVTAGGKRYELFITSTEQKNAMVNIQYKPDNQP